MRARVARVLTWCWAAVRVLAALLFLRWHVVVRVLVAMLVVLLGCANVAITQMSVTAGAPTDGSVSGWMPSVPVLVEALWGVQSGVPLLIGAVAVGWACGCVLDRRVVLAGIALVLFGLCGVAFVNQTSSRLVWAATARLDYGHVIREGDLYSVRRSGMGDVVRGNVFDADVSLIGRTVALPIEQGESVRTNKLRERVTAVYAQLRMPAYHVVNGRTDGDVLIVEGVEAAALQGKPATDVAGRMLLVAIEAGAPILESDLLPRADSRSLAGLTTISVTGRGGLGGAVKPGQRVDVHLFPRTTDPPSPGRVKDEDVALFPLRGARVAGISGEKEAFQVTLGVETVEALDALVRVADQADLVLTLQPDW